MNNRKEDMEIASHYRQLLRELNEQRQHGVLCDVCVVVEGKVFKAHKNVLLGSSRYFKTLYCQVQKTSDQATVTHLDIVTAQGFKAIIDFMYSAHLALTSRNVIEVMSAASFLQMTDIVQACHDFIKAALDISIKPDASDELSEFELGTPSGSSTDALISAVMAGRSISPWLARHTSPANSSGDSAIASCHEGGSSYGKEDQEPKADGPDDVSSQSLWPGDVGYGSLRIKEEQISPSHYGGSELPSARDGVIQNSFSEQAGGDGWQPTGRRKNRKNKETVRHITQQAEDDSRAGSPVPSFLPTSGWPFSSRDSNADLTSTEASGSDSRGDRAELYAHVDEGLLGGEASYLGPPLTPEKDDALHQATAVANLRAALMSKNSLLSLKADVLGDDSSLLLEYLPKGAHSLALNEFTVIRKKFKCPYCSFSAMHQCILKRHMRSHTGERPYPCEICGKKFTRREHMKRHTLSSGGRRDGWTCLATMGKVILETGIQIRQKKNRVHSKDKKYVCKLCSRVFMSAASVGIKHGSRRHGVCADCAGRGVAGALDGGGAEGSPELFTGDGPYLEDTEDPRGEAEEELGEDEDDVGLAPEDALLGDDKDDEDSPRGPRSPSGGPDKDFAWIS
uniref:Zinc finger and BTB domain containing 46 n=1 Tax=Equus caballus TaxID=9796 RepID=F6VWC7_HORSE|nr:zinc finger and BTB domain-containing protein 46 isoform X1 [Equus caballus]